MIRNLYKIIATILALFSTTFAAAEVVLDYIPDSIEKNAIGRVGAWDNTVSEFGTLYNTHSSPDIILNALTQLNYAPVEVTEWQADNMAADDVVGLNGDSISGLSYTLVFRLKNLPTVNFVMMRNIYPGTPNARRPLDLGFTSDSKVFISSGTSNGGYAAGPSARIDLGKWYVLTCTWDKQGNMALYINGILEGRTSGATLNINDKQHGRFLVETSPQRYFKIDIARIRVQGESLSETDAKQIYDRIDNEYDLHGTTLGDQPSNGKIDNLSMTIAVKDAGLWPTLVKDEDQLYLFVFNSPGHGTLPGDIGCYYSADGGQNWNFRSEIGGRLSSESIQWGQSSGIARNGDLITLVRERTDVDDLMSTIPTKIMRSKDGGISWVKTSEFPSVPPNHYDYFPFGRVYQASDDTLRTFAYSGELVDIVNNTPRFTSAAYMFTSSDDGMTFENPRLVGNTINEVAAVEYTSGHWLAIGREMDIPVGLRQMRSTDDGLTWVDEGMITDHGNIPADLTLLDDGRLILVYGDRSGLQDVETGVNMRQSKDYGITWSEPEQLVALGGDLGYPSAVQLDDGTLLVAFYASRSDSYNGYHTGLIKWHALDSEIK